MKTILVPTDFSPSGLLGAKAALEIAERISAEVCLFTSLPGSSEDPFGEIDLNNPKEGPSILFDHYGAFLKEMGNDTVKTRMVYTYRPLIDGLETFVKKEKIYMIVMGSDGVHGFKNLTGTHAQKVVNHIARPVMVVKRPESSFREIKKILFASDFRKEGLPAFEKLLDFATFYGSTIHLVYIAEPDSDKVDEVIARRRIKFYEDKCWKLPVVISYTGDYNVATGIDFYARENQVDLITMISHGENFWQKLKKGGSIAETIVGDLEFPVLTLRAAKVNTPA